MKKFFILVIIDLKLYFREPANIIWLILMPLFFLVIFGLFFNTQSITIDTLIVDRDRTQISNKFISIISSYSTYKVKVSEKDVINEKLKKINTDVVIVLNKGFENSIKNKKYTYIDVYLNSQDSQKLNIQSGILMMAGPGINMDMLNVDSKINLNLIIGDNHKYSYVEFLLPGLIAMIIFGISIYNIGLKLSIYRQYHQLKILYLLPIKRLNFLISQILNNMIYIIIQIIIMFIFALLIFRISLPKDIFSFLWAILISSVMFMALGFLITSLCKTYSSSMLCINIIYLPFIFLSGIYISIDFFPIFLKYFAYISPLYHSTNMIRNAYIGYFDKYQFIVQNIILLCISFFSIIITLNKFRWSNK